MNGKKSRALRRMSHSRQQHRALKRAYTRGDGQNPKPLRERRHVAAAPHRATWPRTFNQKGQSRPLIAVHPVRDMLEDTEHPRARWRIRSAGSWMPKHMLDAGWPA